MEIQLLSIIALGLTALFGMISLYFRSKYNTFKQLARDFVDVISKLVDMIEDDEITEDEIKEFITKVKYLIMKAQKLIGSFK